METAVSTRPSSLAYALPGIVRRQPKPEEIDRAVAREYGLAVADLSIKSRKREIVEPRQVGMYLNKKYTQLSLGNIGVRYTKDHATVLHAYKTVKNLKDTDRHFSARLQTIVDKLAIAYDLKPVIRAQGFYTEKLKQNE